MRTQPPILKFAYLLQQYNQITSRQNLTDGISKTIHESEIELIENMPSPPNSQPINKVIPEFKTTLNRNNTDIKKVIEEFEESRTNLCNFLQNINKLAFNARWKKKIFCFFPKYNSCNSCIPNLQAELEKIHNANPLAKYPFKMIDVGEAVYNILKSEKEKYNICRSNDETRFIAEMWDELQNHLHTHHVENEISDQAPLISVKP